MDILNLFSDPLFVLLFYTSVTEELLYWKKREVREFWSKFGANFKK